MNPELEEAKKKIREGVVAYVRAAYKASGSVEIAAPYACKGNQRHRRQPYGSRLCMA